MAVEIRTEPGDDGIGRAIVLTCCECGHEYVRIHRGAWSSAWACPSCEDVE